MMRFVLTNDDGVGARGIPLLRQKSASQGGLDTERIEVVSGHEHPIDAIGVTVHGEAHRLHVGDDESGKNCVLLPKVDEIGIRKAHVVTAKCAVEYDDSLLAGYARESVDQESMDPGENRRVGTDPDGEGQDGGKGENGILRHHADRKSHVLKKSAHRFSVNKPRLRAARRTDLELEKFTANLFPTPTRKFSAPSGRCSAQSEL